MSMSKPKSYKKNGRAAKNGTKHSIKRTLSSYNLFYTLERTLFLRENKITPPIKYPSAEEWNKYGDIARVFPPRPSRYRYLELSDTWFLRRKEGSINFSRTIQDDTIDLKGLSKAISSSWKSCDSEMKEAKAYVTTIAKILKKRHDEILSGKSSSGTRSSSPSQSRELSLSDVNPEFARRVSMNSSASIHSAGAMSTSKHDVPHAVHNAFIMERIKQQQANPYGIFPLSYPNKLREITRAAYSNAELNRMNADVMDRYLGLSGAHGGMYMRAAGQYKNKSYATVKNNISEESYSTFLSEWGEEVSQQYTETEEDANFESFLSQDPDKSGWQQSAYFKSNPSTEVTELVGMKNDRTRKYAAGSIPK